MIVYSDHTIQLDFVPEDNVLITSLQEERAYNAKEVRNAFISIVTCVKEKHITGLLLDFTRNTYDLPATEYKETVAQLTVGLLQTSLRKVARLGTPDPVRENKIGTMFSEIQSSVHVPIKVRMFATKEEALQWLLS